jgi:fluoride exporter
MANYLLLLLGSSLGGLCRYWLSGWTARRWGESFPAGTLLVNVTGAFAAGIVARWAGVGTSAQLEQFVIIGLLGGYTTVSAFSLQTLHLLQEGQWRHAGANVLCSYSFCILAVLAGSWVGGLIAANLI